MPHFLETCSKSSFENNFANNCRRREAVLVPLHGEVKCTKFVSNLVRYEVNNARDLNKKRFNTVYMNTIYQIS